MQELLVYRRQLIFEDDIQLLDNLLVALHDRLHVLFRAP
jgi:GR25 family glycosyltransferase involved in LPS biosynthesis